MNIVPARRKSSPPMGGIISPQSCHPTAYRLNHSFSRAHIVSHSMNQQGTYAHHQPQTVLLPRRLLPHSCALVRRLRLLVADDLVQQKSYTNSLLAAQKTANKRLADAQRDSALAKEELSTTQSNCRLRKPTWRPLRRFYPKRKKTYWSQKLKYPAWKKNYPSVKTMLIWPG
ncbi:hypothetical protein BD779DRAFT_474560 [Infundibulicybe gibba]|nr:hypothetical protein BD779DRAFT_474560 [Infundibulicybe gibba]